MLQRSHPADRIRLNANRETRRPLPKYREILILGQSVEMRECVGIWMEVSIATIPFFPDP